MWEAYSTPLRDRKIRLLFWYLDRLLEQNHVDSKPLLAKMENVKFDIGNKRTIDLLHIYKNREWLSYDPDDSIEMRWGLAKCAMIRSRLRTLQESIHFVEAHYGESDPAYARRIIAQYEEERGRLKQEENASQCEWTVMDRR